MEVAERYRELIKTIVINNARFKGNEDFVEDFCSETFKRSYRILSSIKSIKYVESYLNKVANSSILEVLKTSGRLTRTTNGYQKINVASYSNSTENSDEIIYDIPDPAPPAEDSVIEKELITQIAEFLMIVNQENSEKQYLQLFNMRYVKNLKQTEIAKELDISQSEVSKRLVEITSKINQLYLENQ